METRAYQIKNLVPRMRLTVWGANRWGSTQQQFMYIPINTYKQNLEHIRQMGGMATNPQIFYFRRTSHKGKSVLRIVPFAQIRESEKQNKKGE